MALSRATSDCPLQNRLRHSFPGVCAKSLTLLRFPLGHRHIDFKSCFHLEGRHRLAPFADRFWRPPCVTSLCSVHRTSRAVESVALDRPSRHEVSSSKIWAILSPRPPPNRHELCRDLPQAYQPGQGHRRYQTKDDRLLGRGNFATPLAVMRTWRNNLISTASGT